MEKLLTNNTIVVTYTPAQDSYGFRLDSMDTSLPVDVQDVMNVLAIALQEATTQFLDKHPEDCSCEPQKYAIRLKNLLDNNYGK